MIDCNLFLFICSFVCVSAALWSLHSGALARPSAVRPFLAGIAIVITSLFVFVSTEAEMVMLTQYFIRSAAFLPALPRSGTMWSVLANELRAEGRGSPPGLSTGKGEFSVCLAILCGMWRPHDQNGKSDYGCSLDFWVTRTRSRLSGSEE